METTYHYNGKVVLGFDPIKHIYTLNGEKVSGVTTVLQVIAKPALIAWAARMAAEHMVANLIPGVGLDEVAIKELARNAQWAHRSKKDAAADTGSMVHTWIESYVKGENPPVPMHSGMRQATQGFAKWWSRQESSDGRPELRLCSPTHKLAGTVDWPGKLNGKLTILDWKTGSGIYPEMLLQLGAYAIMYEEEYGEKVEQVGIVNCSVKSTFSYFITDQVELCKELYLLVLKLSKDLKQLETLLKEKSK